MISLDSTEPNLVGAEVRIMTIRDGGRMASATEIPSVVRYWHNRVRRAAWFNPDREMAVVLCLNTKHRIVAYSLVSLGTLNETIVHPREVFRTAIALNAYGIIFMHNHPSGDPSPSEPDRTLTDRLSRCGDLLMIRVVDHIIVGRADRHFSFKAEDILNNPFGIPLSGRTRGRKRRRSASPSVERQKVQASEKG